MSAATKECSRQLEAATVQVKQELKTKKKDDLKLDVNPRLHKVQRRCGFMPTHPVLPPSSELGKLQRGDIHTYIDFSKLVSDTDVRCASRWERETQSGCLVEVQAATEKRLWCIADWVCACGRWTTALFMLDSETDPEVNVFALREYSVKVCALAKEADDATAIKCDSIYRASLPAKVDTGTPLMECLTNAAHFAEEWGRAREIFRRRKDRRRRGASLHHAPRHRFFTK
eukprot:GHVQ01021301.1.p1 GENE.GHVQ01021301.1~~GHVQ01021301.1.p1  ORF type:complete len:229 (-),score=22.38 GHVQ01021301.1:345-1031(-)